MSDALKSLLKDFISVEWSACPNVLAAGSATHVYALIADTGSECFPLYVGQTRRLLGRVGDYEAAQFKAPTDFRVGRAIQYLTAKKKCRVDFRYRPSASHLKDEKLLIRELLLSGYILLNFLGAFDYNDTIEENELVLVHRFCDMAILHAQITQRWGYPEPSLSPKEIDGALTPL
jgi:hypothetical protein